ncbi:MAG: hypothetical protein JST89_06580 [Cyanobacteria bacterium SZAS-4]|nr:hypothetical protein [Cyanobacteria bacterium SZAS-4]
MNNNENEMEQKDNSAPLRSRRTVLKILAGAPLFITFGLVASPLMRFLKPTMKPENFFQEPDLPTADRPPLFNISEFPDAFFWLPFSFPMKYLVFNPEQHEIRQIPGLLVKLQTNEVVAYSRICPKQRSHILSYLDVRPMLPGCGCADKSCLGACIGYAKGPVLLCPHGCGIFDVSDNGRVLKGSTRPPRQFAVDRSVDWITITGLKEPVIV